MPQIYYGPAARTPAMRGETWQGPVWQQFAKKLPRPRHRHDTDGIRLLRAPPSIAPMSVQNLGAVTLLVLTCAGCGSWSGFGFDPGGPEMTRLRQVLALKEGMVLADVGAGKGQLTLALAREVGSGGRVFSTEIDPARLARLREAAGRAGLDNVTVVEAQSRETGLPPSCCDAIVLRRVYHHLTDPTSINASLLQSLRPGGVLVIIDLPPPFSWPRGSLGVPAQVVIDEIKASGFELVQLIGDWPGRGPLESYCAVFRRPLTGVSIHQPVPMKERS
jgi:ubiquinone/menaquinone biosynthesis C-methylase UbiE